MNINRSETHVSTWSGPWADPVSGNIQFTQIGNDITLLIPTVQAVSTTPANIVLDTPLISRLRPVTTIWGEASIRDDSTIDNGEGLVTIGTNGVITIQADKIGNGFVGGGQNTGFRAFPISYTATIIPGFDNQI